MKRKARIQMGIDDRLVAIYARKSRITNKGDSIGVQFKQSADYAINQLSLSEDYEFARYEDKGLSGYYSDRPDFQRLLRDIEMGKIKAVACYKLDRISRKTSDLMRLLEYFERHDVTLLVCSNNINTRISTSKIIIQVLAIIAEFERDILTERIQDNLMELAKDGRWLGGKTPTGFSSQRVTTGSGKNKSAISFLVPVQEEKEIVLEIYSTFWETRSLLQTANIISEKYETKHGAKFTTSTIRLILRNPIYCVADEYSYNYFLEHDGNLFGEPSDFDGQHGLTAYNKTDQMKVEDEDSTFFNPKFSQLLTRKPISEWIVSVGRHEGFISSRKWVETQNMLDEIAEKYNRPHRKTNALLSGLMYCPICGKRLRVLPESNRWTNGKPRFKYACPGVRAKECTFKGVEGVTLDEFVIHSLSSLQEEHSDYYRQLLENRVASMIRTDQSEKEYQETKKAIERLNADIAAQVRNLREADDALKRFIQDDIKELTDELAKREAALRRMEDTQSENQYLIHELNGMKKRLLSFEEFAKDAQPEALFTLVHSIVDRIYITTDGTKQKCQVYIKGCATEDYSDVLGTAGYIKEEPLLPVVSYMPPMCDLDYYSIYMIVFAFPFLNGLPICMEGVVCCGLAMIFLVMASPGASARPLAAAFIVALLFGILLPKQKMEKFFDDPFVWQERIEKLLQKTAVGGVTDGKLGTVDEIVDSGEEQLEIILSERPKQRVYLQGFVGMDYGDNEWTSSQNTDFLSSDDIHEVRKLEYETVKNNPNKVQYQSVKANIIRKGADRKYSYIPYKSNFTERMYGDAYVRGGKVSYSVDVLLVGNVGSMGANPENVTYEETDKMALYLEFVNERYLQVPEKFYDQWIEEISGMQDRTLRALVKNIADYLEDKAEYSKSPGKTPSGEDFVSYFLEKSKKGYCVHFASAGVLFLRMKGIPARFVSGYVAKPSDFHETQDGTYKAVLDDSAAHAWAEIYVKGCGWLPAEMTPGYRNDDDPLVNTQHNTQQEVSGQETQQTPEQDLTENEELPKTENIQGKEQETKEKEDDVEAEKDKVHGIIIVLRNVIFAVAVLIVTVVIIWKRKWRMIRLQKSGKKRYLQTFSLMREMMEVDLGKEIPEEAGMIMQTLKEEYGIVSERAQNVVRHAMETTYGNRKMRKGDVARMKKLALTVRSRIKKKRKGIRNFIFFFRKGF